VSVTICLFMGALYPPAAMEAILTLGSDETSLGAVHVNVCVETPLLAYHKLLVAHVFSEKMPLLLVVSVPADA